MSKNNYDANSIETIKDDVERLKKRYSMYIGYTGWRAFLHLIKEVLQNSIDEGVAVESCDKIKITYDEKSKVIIIEDNGRGIPHEKVVEVVTFLQSSGKFSKGVNGNYQFASGQNGVGITAVNALSEKMIITSCRNNKMYQAVFKNGRLIQEGVISVGVADTGTRIEFCPNETILGNTFFDYNELVVLCEQMSYLAKGLKFILKITKLDGEVIKETFKSNNGIIDCILNKAGKNRIIEPIYIGAISEDGSKMAEIAITYSIENHEESITSFANFCTTVEHGTHVVGFKQGLSNVLTKYVKETCLSKKDKDLDIIADDVRNGLVAVVNVNHIDASFVGQVKEKLNNEDMIYFVRRTLTDGLKKWLKENEKPAKKLGEFIKKLAKVRTDATRARKNAVAKDVSVFNRDLTGCFDRANGNDNLTLYLVEGDSAKGTAKTGRDPKTQALFALKGVPANTYGFSISKILANAELNKLITVLGTNIGKKFDIRKLKYKKIIIMTDADVDGNRISSLLIMFFLIHMPEIIKAGILFKVIPPLYRVKYKNKERFLTSKKEYIKLLENEIKKNFEIADKNNNKLSNKEIGDLLYRNRQYDRTLKKLANRLVIDKTVLEYCVMYRDNYKKLSKAIKKNFKFLEFNEKLGILRGIANQEYQAVVLDKGFFKKLEPLIEFSYINNDELIYHVNGDKMTLGQMLDIFDKYEPKNVDRYKGLGEMNSEQLWDTTLNPDTQTLVQITSDNIEEDIERFRILHDLNNKEKSDERKLMMATFKLNFEDIDN